MASLPPFFPFFVGLKITLQRVLLDDFHLHLTEESGIMVKIEYLDSSRTLT